MNRALVVVLLLITMVACTIALVAPGWTLYQITWQSDAAMHSLNRLQPYVRVALGVLCALTLDVILVLLIILEMRRPAAKAIRVEQTAGGEVQISVNSIADRLRYEVDQLPGILRTKAKVSSKRGGVVAELDVETAAGTTVPEQAEQIVETAQQVVEEKMGLKLARPPKVNLRAVPYPAAPKSRPPAPRES
jgi:hypothetical protein